MNRTDRSHRDHMSDADLFKCPYIGPVIYFVRCNCMVESMARQEADADAIQFTMNQRT